MSVAWPKKQENMSVRIRIAAIVLIGLAAALFAFSFSRKPATWYASSTTSNNEPKPDNEPSASPTTRSASTSSADIVLAQEIERAIDQSDFASARWGVFVISLRDGRVLYSRGGDKLFTPASNMKIYTTAVALDLLGADYRWRTSVYALVQPDANGTVSGDLTLYGRGAPDLVSQRKEDQPSLAQLADQLYARGVRRVQGNVVGDESYFRGNPFGDGWLWNDIQWYFGAAASALSIDANEIELTITPASTTGKTASVALNRGNDYFHVTNNVATVERGNVTSVGINRGLTNNELVVWGEFPAGGRSFGARLAVPDPALWAAELFREALVTRGITVDGQPRSRDFRLASRERFDPQHFIELAAVTSKTLVEIVVETNKKSINLNAELVLRTLGRERGAIASDPDPHKMRERGDDEAGLAVVRVWLKRAGIATNNLALHDGSGLSRLDLVTPEATARLLAAIAKTSAGSAFRRSLPVAGQDGTLAFRMKAAEGHIAAKTGSLTYDEALSGYATSPGGDDLAFSVVCNDAIHRGSSISIMDKIGLALASYGGSDQQKPQQK